MGYQVYKMNLRLKHLDDTQAIPSSASIKRFKNYILHQHLHVQNPTPLQKKRA